MHFKGLDLNLIVILDALLEEQSVTRAAERVHVSQPAVSAALAKLRRHTGDELLQKVGRDFILTARAQSMVEPVKEILRQIESTISPSSEFDPSQSDRTFQIAMSSYAAEVLTPGLVGKIATSYPRISCEVEDIHTESLARVKKGAIDCCITFQQTTLLNPRESVEELSHAHAFSDEWVLIAASGNDLVTERTSFEEFCSLPYVETRMGRDLRSLPDRILDQQIARPRVILSVPSFELAITSVMNSDCVAVVPSLLIDDRLRSFLKMFRPPFAMPTLEEFLVWHSRNDAEPGHKWFRQLVFEVALEMQPSARLLNG